MEYLEIKKKIASTEKRLNDILQDKKDLNENIDLIKKSIDEIDSKKSNRIESEEKLKKENHLKELKEPFENSINKLMDKKAKLTEKRDNYKSKITFESYKEKFEKNKSEENDIENIRILKENLRHFYGKEFSKIALNLVPKNNNSIITNLNNLKHSSVLFRKRNFTLFDRVFNSLEDSNSNNEDPSSNNYKIVGMVIVCIIIIFLFFKFSFLISLLLIGYLSLTLYKSNIFVKCCSSCATIESKVKNLNDLLNQKVRAKMSADLKSLEDKYNSSINSIDRKIDEQHSLMEEEIEKKGNYYDFDASKIEESYKRREFSKREELRENEDKIRCLENEFEELSKSLIELNSSLREAVSKITEEYMDNKIGTNKLLPNNYLIDIKDGTPEFFKRPKGTSLFLYDNNEDVYNFIRLLYFQTLCKTSPECFIFNLFDIKTLGSCLGEFLNDDTVKVFSSTEEIKDKISITNIELKKRVRLLPVGKTIDDYNEELDKEECPTEVYNLFFFFEFLPNSSIPEPEVQLYVNGGTVGFLSFLFLNKSEINKENKTRLLKFISSDLIDDIYNLSNGIRKRSKDFLVEILNRIN